jgi:predicted lipoprotein with Yx(FWY)xxD motif
MRNVNALRFIVRVFSIVILAALAFSCHKQHEPAPVPPTVSPALKVATSNTLGTYIADSKGRTLYVFAPDIDGTSKCAGGCLLVWPPFYDSSISVTTIPNSLTASDFTTVTATNGQKQTAYRGWPLYYYAPKDTNGNNVAEAAGETKGENVGKVWFVAKPAYDVMIASKTVLHAVTKDSSAKQFLVDSAGNTLYYFLKDELKPDSLSTNCIGNCILTWPVFHGNVADLPSLLLKTDFGEIVRNDGPGGTQRKQTTYRGRPLYYYTPDAFQKGAAKGQGVGNNWFVTAPDVTSIKK